MILLRVVLEFFFRVLSVDWFYLCWIKIIWVWINFKFVNGVFLLVVDEVYYRCEFFVIRLCIFVEEFLGVLICCFCGVCIVWLFMIGIYV